MSGHSKWSTIKRKKGAADAKRGQVFTRLAREISIAARQGGGDPNANTRLRIVIDKARAQNMPKDNIERAIQRGTGEGKEGGGLEEVIYEGYAPHGIALLVECVTDNRNRAVAEIRHVLTRYGGSMGETGSVSFGSSTGWRTSASRSPSTTQTRSSSWRSGWRGRCDLRRRLCRDRRAVDNFKEITDRLEAAKIDPEEAELRMVPTNEIELDPDETVQVMRVMEHLEELDDVQNVYSNLRVTDEALAQLEAA
jgi:transcriptional/translational regulatory protein YebC/TACO1